VNSVLTDAEIAVETDSAQVDATGVDAAKDTLTPDLLQALLEEARAKLDELARSIGAVDAELESLSAARAQHQALQVACDALDELGAIGGAELFWDDSTPAGERVQHMARVRARIEEFQQRLGEIEGRRRKLLEEMKEQHGETELLEDDAFEAQEEE